jgi:PST family polysaccharide transporter
VRGAAATFLAQGLRFVLQFGSQIVLAHLLSPTDFGLVAMIGPVLMLIQIFNELGLSQATIQRAEISQQELSSLFWLNVGISALLAVIMAGGASSIALFYGQPQLTPICMCLAALLVTSGLASQQIALLNRHMRFSALASIDIACSAVAVAVGIAAAWLGMGYWSLVLMQAANALTILAMAWTMSDWRPSWPRRHAGMGALLRFGGHVTGYNLINYAGTNLDSVLIGKLSGSVALGLFDRATKLVASPIWQISLPVARVAVSLLSRLRLQEDRYRRAYLRMLQGLLLATVPAVVCIAMTADHFVPLLLGQAWTQAAPIVMWLAVATIFAPLSISSYWLFLSQGRVAEQLTYVGIKTGISICALLLGLHWGALGVAQSYAAFAVLVHGSLLWGATRTGPVGRADILRACYPFVVGGGTAALVLSLLEKMAALSALPVGGRLLAEAMISYAVCGLTLVASPEGLRVLRDVWQLRFHFLRLGAQR